LYWLGRQALSWKEVSRLDKPDGDKTVTAEQLGLRELPRGWSRAPLSQLVWSARRIVEQSEATGGSGDPRLAAALRVLEFKQGVRSGRKRK
jgi:hypothetical protein